MMDCWARAESVNISEDTNVSAKSAKGADHSCSTSCYAHDRDAGDLALGAEAEQKAGQIGAREHQLHLRHLIG
jgi:hypothetical protein